MNCIRNLLQLSHLNHLQQPHLALISQHYLFHLRLLMTTHYRKFPVMVTNHHEFEWQVVGSSCWNCHCRERDCNVYPFWISDWHAKLTFLKVSIYWWRSGLTDRKLCDNKITWCSYKVKYNKNLQLFDTVRAGEFFKLTFFLEGRLFVQGLRKRYQYRCLTHKQTRLAWDMRLTSCPQISRHHLR